MQGLAFGARWLSRDTRSWKHAAVYGTVFAGFITWACINYCHIRFMRALRVRQALSSLMA